MAGFAEWLQATPVSVKIQAVDWIIPLLQSIHIVGIGVVFVSSLMIALRVLGRLRADEPFNETWQRFAPWMWRGLIVMVITGAILVVGEPVREFSTFSFWMKMALLAIVTSGTALLGRSLRPVAASNAQAGFSGGAKATAIVLIALWLAIIFLGRAIAYDVEVWGAMSLHSA